MTRLNIRGTSLHVKRPAAAGSQARGEGPGQI